MRALAIAFLVAAAGCPSLTAVDLSSCQAANGEVGVYGPALGSIPIIEAGSLVSCDPCFGGVGSREDANWRCALAYPGLPAGCEAVCDNATCEQRCAGHCTSIPDGGCVPGGTSCPSGPGPLGPFICDPTCAPSGGCIHCAHDSECAAQYGAGATCQQHCGTCCVPGSCGVCL